MSRRVVLAVDGGNSKTDLALVRDDGTLLAHVRGPLSSPHHLGLEGALGLLEGMLDEALATRAGRRGRRRSRVARCSSRASTSRRRRSRCGDALEERGWAARTVVGNDTFAVLRAGTERGWGVAVVCGAGINCVGVAPDGRVARFPSLGAITGDWGGGYDVGPRRALRRRAQRGRARPRDVPRAHRSRPLRLRDAARARDAIHAGAIQHRRLIELAPLVLERARPTVSPPRSSTASRRGRDDGAVGARRGSGSSTSPPTSCWAAGCSPPETAGCSTRSPRGLHALGPQLVVRATDAPPVVGAALLGLDALGAGPSARAGAARAGAAAASTTSPRRARAAGEAVGG